MRLDTYTLPSKLPPARLSDTTVIIVDVLRASSTIITAIENGAAKLIPCIDPGSAAAIASRLGINDCLLAGERGGLKLPDFDLGNSPLEFTFKNVGNRSIVFSTTNGTSAINAAQEARHVLIGGMINRTAVAKKALAYGCDIAIICAGTEGMDSADDICTAGGIAEAIGRCSLLPVQPSDMTLISTMMYADYKAGRADLAMTYHYARLMRLGFKEDIDYCLNEDSSETVPELINGVII